MPDAVGSRRPNRAQANGFDRHRTRFHSQRIRMEVDRRGLGYVVFGLGTLRQAVNPSYSFFREAGISMFSWRSSIAANARLVVKVGEEADFCRYSIAFSRVTSPIGFLIY